MPMLVPAVKIVVDRT